MSKFKREVMSSTACPVLNLLYESALVTNNDLKRIVCLLPVSDLLPFIRHIKNSNAEIDYLIQLEGEFVPVEVKDGPSGKLRSLHLYRDAYNPSCSVVFHAGMKGSLKEENIFFLPLYFATSFVRYRFE